MTGRPHRGPSRGRLERDERGAEPAPAEEEVPRRRQLRRDLHAPVQVVAVGLHAEEGPCVHGAAPYRDAVSPQRRDPKECGHVAARRPTA